MSTSTVTDPPLPRPSSTVVLVRDAAAAAEVFMVKRHQSASFGSAYAFPGGVLEADDALVHDALQGRKSVEANELLQTDNALDYYSAAIRELFEESGVLLGETELDAQQLADARAGLNDASLSWREFVAGSQLRLHAGQLHYFSFWITPVGLPKRYSTRFFLAQMPEDSEATHCGGELTDSTWLSAGDVLAAHRDKAMRVHYPTRKTLQQVELCNSVGELLEWARACGNAGVVCDQPVLPPEALRS